MSEVAVKQAWNTYRFDEMATIVNDRVDNPEDAGVDRYVGLGHLDPESLKIRRWGSPSDVTATKLRFRTGDIIFGRRRVYQRKLAVADFEGICSAHAMVLRAKPEVALPEFLPFFMQTDLFMERAKEISVGSLSPTINWKTLAKQKFALPPMNEQGRIATMLKALEASISESIRIRTWLERVLQALLNEHIESLVGDIRFRPASLGRPNCRPLSALCTHIVDCLHRTPVYAEQGFIAIRTPDVGANELFLDQAYRVSEAEYLEQTKRLIPEPGDILFSREAPMGRAAVIPPGVKLCISQRMMHIRVRGESKAEYLAEMFNSQFVQDQISRLAVGSTVPHINVADVKRLLIPSAGSEEDSRIAAQAIDLRAAMRSAERPVAELLALRSYLSRHTMNGPPK
jgi:restriction endonuclease S subunit